MVTLSLIAVAALLFLALLGLQNFGYRVGRKQASVGSLALREGVSVVDGAVFALLGLLLAFQFSAAASRLETRRTLAVREANAIGTAYLRLDLLGPEAALPMRTLFREYLEVRIRTIESAVDLSKALKAYQEADALQQNIWSNVMIFSRDKPDAVPILLVTAVNEMIDVTAERKAAGLTHAPLTLQSYLIVLAMISAYLAGNAMSRSERLPKFHMAVFAAVISVTIFMILDMEYPRAGFIRIGAADQPTYDLRELMK